MSKTLTTEELLGEDTFTKKILPSTIKLEGGKTTDHRGDTNFGWSQPTYDEYTTSRGLPKKRVFDLTEDEAVDAYRDKFYKEPRIDALPDEDVQAALFDFHVNAGGTAIKKFQSVIGADPDGKIGPQTIKRTEEYLSTNGKDALIGNLLNEREAHYKNLIEKNPAKYKKYEKGWMNRVKEQRSKFDLSSLNPFQVKEASAAEIMTTEELMGDVMTTEDLMKEATLPDPRSQLNVFQKVLTSPVSEIFNQPPEFFENIKKSFKRGEASAMIDQASYLAMTGQLDYEKDVKPLKDAQMKAIESDPVKGKNVLVNAIYSVAEMLPAMGQGIVEGAGTGAIAGGVFAVSGVGAPAAPAAFIAGQTAGSFDYWRRQGAGSLYAELKEKQIDDSIAKPASHIGGALYGAVEFSQVDKLFPGTEKEIKSLVSRSLKKTITRFAAAYGKNWIEEVGEEGVQEIVNETTKEVAAKISGKNQDKNVGKIVLDVLGKGWEASKESALPMLLLLAPGAAVDAKNIVKEEKIKGEIRREMARRVIDEVKAEEKVKLAKDGEGKPIEIGEVESSAPVESLPSATTEDGKEIPIAIESKNIVEKDPTPDMAKPEIVEPGANVEKISPTRNEKELETSKRPQDFATAEEYVAYKFAPKKTLEVLSTEIKNGKHITKLSDGSEIAVELPSLNIIGDAGEYKAIQKDENGEYKYDIVGWKKSKEEVYKAAIEHSTSYTNKIQKEKNEFAREEEKRMVNPIYKKIIRGKSNQKTINEVYEFLNSNESGDFDYAIRGDDYTPKKSFRKSKYHGDDTKEFQLSGVSAINIPAYGKEYVEKAVTNAKKYGEKIFLIKGKMKNAHSVFNDPSEVLIEDNKIVFEIIDDPEIDYIKTKSQLTAEWEAAQEAPIGQVSQPAEQKNRELSSDEIKRKTVDEMELLLSEGENPQLLGAPGTPNRIWAKSTNPQFFQVLSKKVRLSKAKMLELFGRYKRGEAITEKEAAKLDRLIEYYQKDSLKGFKYAELKADAERQTKQAIDRKDIEESESSEIIQYEDAVSAISSKEGSRKVEVVLTKNAADFIEAVEDAGGKLLEVSSPEESNETNLKIFVPAGFDIQKNIDIAEGRIAPSGDIRLELQATIKKNLFQEEGELFSSIKETDKEKKPSAPRSAASVGSFAEELIQTTNKQEAKLKPIETIELIKLAKTLMEDYPTIKNLPKSRGLFQGGPLVGKGGKGSIKLIPDLFKRGNEKQLAATLAHEIGHLVDYLPEKTLKRGNILGRIASLKDFLKNFLPKLSSISEEYIIRPKDRERIRKRVEKEIGPRPEDSQAIIDWRKQKKSDRGNRPEDSKAVKEWKRIRSEKYAKAIMREADNRGLIQNKDLRDEMIKLSFTWRPVEDSQDPDYMAYRSSGKEIYADAISALLNNPEWVSKQAPTFYKLFFEYLDRKPEVKEAYIAAQKMMNGTPEDIMAARQQDVRMMFAKGEAIREQLDAEAKLHDVNIYERMRQMFEDKYYPLIKKLESQNRNGVIPKSEAVHLLREIDLWKNEAYELTRKIDIDVLGKLKDTNVTMADLSEYMFLRRIIGKTSISADEVIDKLKSSGLEEYLGGLGIEIVDTKEQAAVIRDLKIIQSESGVTTEETPVTSWEEQVEKWREKNSDREDLANPLGFSPETAQKQIDFLKSQVGDESFLAIEKAADTYHDLIFNVMEDAVKSGVYSKKVFDTVIAPNKNYYVTFGVLDYLESVVPTAIKSQRGTLKEVESPFITTILKTISLQRANAKNKAVSSAIEQLAQMFPEDAVESKRIIIGGVPAMFAKPKGDKGQVKFLKDGKPLSYDVDKYIAESFAKDSPSLIALGAGLNKFLGNKFFKGLVITYSPAFQIFNIQRDFKRTYINLNALGKKVTILNLLGEYWKALPVAIRRMTGVNDALIEEMMNNKALDVPFNDFNFDDREDGFARILRKFNVIGEKAEVKTAREKIINFAMRIDSAVRFVGNVIETLPKVSGYNIMKAKGASDREAGFATREYIGTPNFRTRGSFTGVTNELFVFSNIMIQGVKSDARLATNPSTRSGFWWADFRANHALKLLMIAAAMGLGGEWLKEWFDKVPEYDKTNFIILPLGEDEEGRAIYLRMPHNETSRMVSAILWKLGTATEMKKGNPIFDVFSIAGGILPSISPAISLASGWLQYLTGRNPYDDFKGRYAISDRAWQAGGWPALKKMVEYSFNETGFSQFTTYDDRRDKTFEAAMKATPFINSIYRIIKTSDYGLSEKAMAISEKEKKESAQRTLKRNELFEKNLKGYTADKIGSMMDEGGVRSGSTLSRELQNITKNIYDNPDKDDFKSTEKAFIRYALREYNNPYVKAILSAPNNETKIKILQEAKDTISQAKYYEMSNRLRKVKIISKDVFNSVE